MLLNKKFTLHSQAIPIVRQPVGKAHTVAKYEHKNSKAKAIKYPPGVLQLNGNLEQMKSEKIDFKNIFYTEFSHSIDLNNLFDF